MLFMHVVADYNLQGVLAEMKCKDAWKEDPLVKHDYVVALLMHSFEWAFLIMLPLALWHGLEVGTVFCLLLIFNTLFHMLVDHLKANVRSINLCQDQFHHFLQILWTFVLVSWFGC